MIGQRLRELRQRLGIGQVDLGEVMGYSQPMISEIERGVKAPSHESIVLLVREFGISTNWLYGFTEEDMGKTGDREEPGEERRREITPEEAIRNYELIQEEPLLALKLRGGNLDVYDMADIANYIRKVRSGKVQQGVRDDEQRQDSGA